MTTLEYLDYSFPINTQKFILRVRSENANNYLKPIDFASKEGGRGFFNLYDVEPLITYDARNKIHTYTYTFSRFLKGSSVPVTPLQKEGVKYTRCLIVAPYGIDYKLTGKVDAIKRSW